MNVKDKLYKNQGIHVITAIFTVEQGITKVLLVKRKNEPFLGDWILAGGALYNNEDLLLGAKREIVEKTGIKDIEIYQFGVLKELQKKIISSTILKSLFPGTFSLPELQKVYEAILGIKMDRRNFRKKILSLDLIEDTGETAKFEGKKPAKQYRFKKKIAEKKVF